MTQDQTAVFACLQASGAMSAKDIGHELELHHDELYVALIGLETDGRVRVTIDYGSEPGRRVAVWEAL